MIEFVFLDLDETILDFRRGEAIGLNQTLRDHGVEPTEDVLSRYRRINRWHWEQLELGNLTRDQVLTGRFAALFRELGVDADPESCARAYEYNLSLNHFFLPGAEEAMETLHGKYKLYLASNGTAFVQHRRMKDANLYRFFEDLFISEEVGHNKPAREFFEAAFARIPGFDRERAVMVGDTLSSDILGGKNAGIRTVWINPSHADPGDIVPDYEIPSIARLAGLLQTL